MTSTEAPNLIMERKLVPKTKAATLSFPCGFKDVHLGAGQLKMD